MWLKGELAMRKTVITLMLSTLLTSSVVWAQEKKGEEMPSVTAAEAEEVTRGYLKDEMLGVKPMLGVIAFRDRDVSQSDTGRFAAGLALDWNAMSVIDNTVKDWYVGPSTGLVYSHLGEPRSNFFGTDSDFRSGNVGGSPGANLLIIPTNLKVAYNIGDYYRIGIHGGGNVIYRSVANSMNLDSESNTADSVWKYYPNAGADVDFGLAKNVALSIRPDWTFTPNDNFLTATVAIGVALS
ncbi:MAG: hypothetical protein AABZ06_06500 [Bdellovibrionota bacterium]